MKRIIAGSIAVILLASSLPALADGWSGRHERRGHGHRHHHHGPNPWVWGAAGLAVGGALFAIEASRPPPVVVAPVVVPPGPPPGRLWYYCEAYGAYYPQVQYCPGGWRTIQ